MDIVSAGSNILRKLAIAAAAGGGGYLLTALAKQPVIWSLTISIFIGGVALVVRFLVDLDTRVSTIDGKFVHINKATELFGKVEDSQLRAATVIELVETSTRIADLRSPLLNRFVDGEILRLTEILRQLVHQQSADHPGDEQDWMLALTANTTKRLRATTMLGRFGRDSVDEAFWRSELASAYLQLQREARQQRNVQVQRLFIVAPGWEDSDDIRQIIKQNLDALVEVRVLVGRPVSGLVEFIIFDDEICQEFPVLQMVSGEPTFAPTTQLTLRQQVVQRRIDQFGAWWARANPLTAGSVSTYPPKDRPKDEG